MLSSMTFLLFLSMAGTLYCLMMLIRNNAVHDYRRRVLASISMLAAQDIKDGRNWQWRYDVFDQVDYEVMVARFWVDLENFYPDKSFMR